MWLLLGRDIGWECSCAISWFDFDLIFDLAVVTLIYEICLGYISETVRCMKFILDRHIG